MKTTPVLAPVLLLLLTLAPSSARAAAFSSGSTGADGPLLVTNNINLVVPADGVFNFTTIDVAAGANLTLRRHEMNTPVYFLATSNVTINGIIDVSGYQGLASGGGEGGPGGFDGGTPPSDPVPAGDGYGPGGGKGGGIYNQSGYQFAGAYGTATPFSLTNLYGNALIQPLIGGSGGGGSSYPGGGGGGGGAILIASSTQIVVSGGGAIYAAGGRGYGFSPYNGGSGGAIRLIAPKTSGTGVIDVSGGTGAGAGRIRIDTQDRSQMNLNMSGRVSVGVNMTVFPSPNPRLDIVEVAGRAVPLGTNATVRIQLPLNPPTNQTVKILATDFIGTATLEVVIAPDNGPAMRFPAGFDIGNTNQLTTTVNVIIPPDVPCRVNAWTR